MSASHPPTRAAASAERGSEHPLGQAIVQAAEARKIGFSAPQHFEAITGQGVRAEIDGHHVLVGNRAFMVAEEVPLNGLESAAAQLQAEAKTAMWLAVDGQAWGIIAVADHAVVGDRHDEIDHQTLTLARIAGWGSYPSRRKSS